MKVSFNLPGPLSALDDVEIADHWLVSVLSAPSGVMAAVGGIGLMLLSIVISLLVILLLVPAVAVSHLLWFGGVRKQ